MATDKMNPVLKKSLQEIFKPTPKSGPETGDDYATRTLKSMGLENVTTPLTKDIKIKIEKVIFADEADATDPLEMAWSSRDEGDCLIQ